MRRLIKRVEKIQIDAEREGKRIENVEISISNIRHIMKRSNVWNWDSRWKGETKAAIIKEILTIDEIHQDTNSEGSELQAVYS